MIWSNGRQTIAKLDYDTLEVLATIPTGTEPIVDRSELEALEAGLDTLDGEDAVGHAIGIAARFMTGLDGIYSLLDCDHTLFLGRKDHAAAYVETDRSDPASPIVERDRWHRPDHIEGFFVGMNITFDGRLVMTTDHGWVICLARDFSEYDAIQLPGAATDAAEHCASRAAQYGHTGYGWVRTSSCTGDDGGIYVSSVDTIHKVVWTGDRLSLDPADGAWSARYRNGGGDGSGTTPSLMGFGPDEDRFVVIGDGDDVVNITLLWRDEIPYDWVQFANAPSRRIAGIGPANMGDSTRAEIKTEQSITVSGYGAMTVNNEPASLPAGWPTTRARLFCFFLGHKPAYTPFGLHKYEWGPCRPAVAGGLGQYRGVLAELGSLRGPGPEPRVHLRHPGREVDDRSARLEHRREPLPLRRRRFALQHPRRRRHHRRRRPPAVRHDLRQGPHPALTDHRRDLIGVGVAGTSCRERGARRCGER